MANWTKNQPSGSTTRRKWNLEDRASLNNLKFHIAAEGCSDVQYDLAKQILEKTIEYDETASTQQAVCWLISAAQQGHEDAVKLLQKCYDDDVGITTENESNVRCCLSMTPGERAARKAARELFACLSNGGEHITPKQLERKMREIYNLQKKRRRRGCSTSTSEDDTEDETEDEMYHETLKDVAASGNGSMRKKKLRKQRRTISPHERRNDSFITEENLVTAAVHYASGRMPSVSYSLTLSVPDPGTLDHVPCFQRLLLHPVIFLTILYHRLINFIATLPSTIPTSARLALLLFVYWIMSSDNLNMFVPVCFYYLTLCIMIWSTCKMLKTKQDFIDFRIWSGLFIRYGDHNVEADISENRFLKNNMKPYLFYFCAFVCNMVLYPIIDVEWLPHSELTTVAGIFVFVSMIAFMYSSPYPMPDYVVLVSFGVNVLAKYPYEMDEVVSTGWRYLDLHVPTFPSFVIGNGIEFCLNCRTPLYLLIPGFLLLMAKRSNWHGIYTYLIPHCVTLSWLQLCIITSQSATMFGMTRTALALAGVLLFLPLFGIVSLLIPIFVAIDWMGFTDPNVRFGSSLVAFAFAILGSCYLAINRTTQKYVTVLQVLACILAACVLTFPYMTTSTKDYTTYDNIPQAKFNSLKNAPTEHKSHVAPEPFKADNNINKFLSWQDFNALCGPQTWENQNKIKSQRRCSNLNGMYIAWEGYVSEVQIARVINMRADLIAKYLPIWLRNLFRCIFGNAPECDVETDQLCEHLKVVLENSSNVLGRCSLHKWNSYEYEIRVKMSSGILTKSSVVILSANHQFGNFTQKLSEGDHIQFYGRLFDTLQADADKFILGSTVAHVRLSAIECLLCNEQNVEPVSVERVVRSSVDARLRDLKCGIKYLLNALLNPLIIFK